MQRAFRLGEYLIRPSLNQIEGCGERHTVEPKAMDVLVYLAQYPGEVIPKERITPAIWSDTFVTDEVLTNAIFQLRKALRDAMIPPQPSHMQDFFNRVRSRKKPRYNEDEAFIEDAAFLMSLFAYHRKDGVWWDRGNEEIV